MLEKREDWKSLSLFVTAPSFYLFTLLKCNCLSLLIPKDVMNTVFLYYTLLKPFSVSLHKTSHMCIIKLQGISSIWKIHHISSFYFLAEILTLSMRATDIVLILHCGKKKKKATFLLWVETEFFTFSLFAIFPLQNQKRILDGQKVTTIICSVSLINSRGI